MKDKGRRLIPQVWEYETGAEDKDGVLLRKINEIILNQKDNKNRFVIFTRYVKEEAQKIGKLLENLEDNRFEKYVNDRENDNKTYKIVTGENSEELSKYTGKENLPTVLILTYQVAEQGVNLPGYNYVINYHISAFPSALEQRFGRIDRMNSDFEEINMCFLISKKEYDSNTWNFYSAMITYLYNLIPYIPSRNTILSKKIMEQYVDFEKIKEKYKQGYRNNVIEKQLENMKNNIEAEILEKDFNIIDLSIKKELELSLKYGDELFELINEKGIEYNNEVADVNEAKNEFIEKIKKELKMLKKKEQEEVDNIINQIEVDIGDKIFYFKNSWSIYEGKKEINNISTVECGKIIKDRDEYHIYKCKFKKEIKFPILFKKFKKEINAYFEEKFIENDFDSIFPFGGYQDVFEEILNKKQIEEDDKQCLINNCDLIVNKLPFFEMCEKYGKILQSLVEDVEGEFIRVRFSSNPFEYAFKLLTTKVKEGAFEISEKLFREYFNGEQKEIYGFECKEGMVEATNWYKLAYYYTRREARCFIKYKLATDQYCISDEYQYCLYGNNNENMYFRNEKKISYILKKYRKNEIWDKLSKLELEPELGGIKKVQSVFTYYIFTENGERRKYIESTFVCDNKEEIKDVWTKAICTEINQKKGERKYLYKLNPKYIYISSEQFIRKQISEIMEKLKHNKTFLIKLYSNLIQDDEEVFLEFFWTKTNFRLTCKKNVFIRVGKKFNMKQITLELLHTIYKEDLTEGLELLSKKFLNLSRSESVSFDI